MQVLQQEQQHKTLEVETVEIIYQAQVTVQQQLLQQSHLLWQQMQMNSNDITIKMMDIYVEEEKFQQSKINVIEGQNITEDAYNKKD